MYVKLVLKRIGPLTRAWHSLNTYEVIRDAGERALRQGARQEAAVWNVNVIPGLSRGDDWDGWDPVHISNVDSRGSQARAMAGS